MDGFIGRLDGILQRVYQRHLIRIVRPLKQIGDVDITHNLTGKGAHGQGAGHFAGLMAAHPIGNDKQSKWLQRFIARMVRFKSQGRVFIVRTNAAHMAGVSHHDMRHKVAAVHCRSGGG